MTPLSNNLFEQDCKNIIMDYIVKHLDKSDDVDVSMNNIYVVWMCRILGNNKALLSTDLPDGMYYEITRNGDTGEYYVDVYKKFHNYSVNKSGKILRENEVIKMPSNVGVITEQGDLGLGFDPLTKEEEKVLNEQSKKDDVDPDYKDE